MRDPETQQPTGADTLAVTPNGSTIYGDGAEENLDPGYLGVTGGNGYIEISGNNDADPNVQVDGSSAAVEGRAGVDTGAGAADLCVNGTEVL